uniref:endonuclease/exonuclease/phosphatase family protein n=1 Tax=Pedobacter schmidteae TaxID=2201271 RepID=UPI000EB2B327|nr:endonuclease/exonuclease/phosphatase family protein [Pedobacter schmidteae]
MKNVIKIIGILFLLFSGMACKRNQAVPGPEVNPPAKAGPIIKVMTYNIHIGNPPSKPAEVRDLQAIANVINSQKPDLVALQEVDVNTQRSGVNVDQAKELARLTGMNYFYAKAIDFQGGQYGDAVLSRFPILESVSYQLPVTQQLGGETRSVAMITVEKEGYKFYFSSTHLDHLGAEDNRLLQAAELNKIVGSLSRPLIIAGDMNAIPSSKTMALLQQQLFMGCNAACPFTIPATAPTRTIDYIMMRPYNKFNIKNYNVINETYASDHLPLIAEIELK